MFHAFDRMGRTAAMVGIATAVMLVLPLGAGPANARSDDGASVQFAQAARQGGAKAAAPAPSGGTEIDRDIADLRKQLKITPQQEAQFNAFADVMRSNAQELDTQMRQGSQTPNAVETLKQAQQLTETQAAGLKRLVPALQSLYDTLSDQQKKVADKVIGGGGEPGPGPGPGPQRGGRG